MANVIIKYFDIKKYNIDMLKQFSNIIPLRFEKCKNYTNEKMKLQCILAGILIYKNLGDINKKLYDKIKNEQNEENEDYFSWTYEEFYKLYLRSEEVEKLKKKEGDYIQKTLVTFITYFKSKEPRSRK